MPPDANGGSTPQERLQREVAAIAAALARVDSQVASLSQQVSGLANRFDEQVGTVSAFSSTIGKADWKTVTAVAALMVGLWQFGLRPIESAVEKLDARVSSSSESFTRYTAEHDRAVYAINATHEEAIKDLKAVGSQRRLATLEAEVRSLTETSARRWDEFIKNAETRGQMSRMEKGPEQ